MEIKRHHFLEYGIVFALSLLFIIMFVAYQSNRDLLKLLSGLISSSYVLWGIIHSALESRLTGVIVFEYLLFGVLAFLILFIALSF
jgi:hypothetical protein